MLLKRSKTLLASGVALAMLASACSDDTSNARPQERAQVDLDPSEITLTSGLAAFDDCSALLDHLRTEGAERVTAYGFGGGGFYGRDLALLSGSLPPNANFAEDAVSESLDQGVATTAPEEFSGESDDSAGDGASFSTTNNQERGVDEPDIVKNDGERILTVSNGTFNYVDVTGNSPVERGSLDVGFGVSQMLVSGDRVFLFGADWEEPEILPLAEDATTSEDVAVSPISYGGPRALIVELDISDPTSPTEVNTLKVDGYYLSARLIDGKASVAIQSDPHDFGFVYPQGPSSEERALESNKEIVAESEIADWLPSFELSGDSGSETGLLTGCEQVHAPKDFSGFGSLSVVTIDMDAPLAAPDAASVLASGQNVYASSTSMYISTNNWVDWGILEGDARIAASNEYTSEIHAFSIAGDRPNYTASGEVQGHLLNQFAMSEHDGVLRVATTDGSPWDAGEQSESFITTFEPVEGALVQIGQVGEMGKGERIFSVRFVGDTAYVVTFRQTDPFYTVDLSDPAAPEVLGELKITGYSGQLHPIGENHVLGIGQEATEEGRTTGAKVTLFDVSDLSNPTDVATWTAPNAWTDAEYDHKAFLYWAPEELAVLPVQSWEDRFFGAVALKVDTDAGTLTEAARITNERPGDTPVGTTSCEVLSVEDLQNSTDPNITESGIAQEAQFIIPEGGQIQRCGEGQSGAESLFCERWFAPAEDGSAIEVCWPDFGGDPILRSIVIDDGLYTLSQQKLQKNDLARLEPGDQIKLSGARR